MARPGYDVGVARPRLDVVLVDRGLAPSRERARALILAGKVMVAGQVVTKAGHPVADDAEVALREEDHPYVSRGALKLVKGLDAFAIDPAGLVCLDIGASTGGFTDVLLRRGATSSCKLARRFHSNPTPMCLISVYSSRPYNPISRPSPLCL